MKEGVERPRRAYCTYCGKAPYQYVFDGKALVPVAVVCCERNIKDEYYREEFQKA